MFCVFGTYKYDHMIDNPPRATLSGADPVPKTKSVSPPFDARNHQRQSPSRRRSMATEWKIGQPSVERATFANATARTVRAVSAESPARGYNVSRREIYTAGPAWAPSMPRRRRCTGQDEDASKGFGFTRAMSAGSPSQFHEKSPRDSYAPDPISLSPRRRRYTDEEAAFSGFTRAMSAGTPVRATHGVSGPLPIISNLEVLSKRSLCDSSSSLPAQQTPTPTSSSRSNSPGRRAQKVISSGAAFYSRVIAQQTQQQQQRRPSA